MRNPNVPMLNIPMLNAPVHLTSRLLPVALATALLALTACGKSPSERLADAAASAVASAASGEKVKIERDGDKVPIKSKDGKEMMDISSGDGIKLPMDFPDDVYLPSDYKVMTSMKMGPAMVVNLVAPGRLGKMFDQADEKMLAQGWEQTMSMQQGADSRILSYKKPDRTATISLNEQDDGGIHVGLQISNKDKK